MGVLDELYEALDGLAVERTRDDSSKSSQEVSVSYAELLLENARLRDAYSHIAHALAFHSQGEEIYWHYGSYRDHEAHRMAKMLSYVSGYPISEPTGLAVGGGFKDWFNDDGSRYLVLLYKTNQFSGELRSSPEGRVFWLEKSDAELNSGQPNLQGK